MQDSARLARRLTAVTLGLALTWLIMLGTGDNVCGGECSGNFEGTFLGLFFLLIPVTILAAIAMLLAWVITSVRWWREKRTPRG